MKVIKYCCLFLLLGLFFVQCRRTIESIEVKDSQGLVVEKFDQLIETKQKHGLYQKFFPSGKLQIEANFDHDTLQGLRTIFYEKGGKEIEENYLDGLFHGEFKSWYPNGKQNAKGQYINGSMEGEWLRYYDSGELREKVNFSNNEENGPFEEYYKNGKKQTTGTYAAGLENGELIKYNDQGEMIVKMNCINGICQTTWKKNDQ